jgi:shikimate kinase
MIVYIVGISCVGKTTVGRLLADNLGSVFYDLDEEVQKFYQKPIERIQNECLSMNGFRKKASIVLEVLFKKEENSVIAGTPSGLRDSYLQVYKKYKKEKDIVSINIIDKPENILNRLTFYDIDSKLLKIKLEENERKKYLKKIIGDLNYFKKSLSRADLQFNIENLSLLEIPDLIKKELNEVRC